MGESATSLTDLCCSYKRSEDEPTPQSILSSARVNTCRLISHGSLCKGKIKSAKKKISSSYFQVLLVFLVGGQCILGARQLRNPAAARRDGKSLVGTFPFNANGGEDDHHHGHLRKSGWEEV